MDKSFWHTGFIDTAEYEINPLQAVFGVKLFIRNDADRSVPVPHFYVLDESGNEFIPVENNYFFDNNKSLPGSLPAQIAPNQTANGTVWFNVPREGLYVLVVEDSQHDRGDLFGGYAHIRLSPIETSRIVQQDLLVENDEPFGFMLNEIESEQQEFLNVPVI